MKYYSIVLLLLYACAFIGCTTNAAILPESTQLTIVGSGILGVGENRQLKVAMIANGKQLPPVTGIIKWKTSGSNIFLAANGMVTATAPGLAVITATYGNLETSSYISVPGSDGYIIPFPGIIIDRSIKLAPGNYDFKGKGGLVVSASNITIDGCNANISSGSYGKGTGLIACGTSNVKLLNLSFDSFKTAVKIADASNIDIEACKLSGTWDDLSGPAIDLNNVSASEIKGNIISGFSTGLLLNCCNNNLIAYNDCLLSPRFGLKMQCSSNNLVSDNNFSASTDSFSSISDARSAGIFLKDGSDFNNFRRNDCSSRGTGILIGYGNILQQSEYNTFANNICDHAHGSGFESYCGNNIYINNSACYCQHGFWLNSPFNTVVNGNEIAYSGEKTGNPADNTTWTNHPGGVIINGSSFNFKFINNKIHDNYGSGLTIGCNQSALARNWIIENNSFENNRNIKAASGAKFPGYGIYIAGANTLYIAGNSFYNNAADSVKMTDNCKNITIINDVTFNNLPVANMIISSNYTTTGHSIKVSAQGSAAGKRFRSIEYLWDFGDGSTAKGLQASHAYTAPGKYNVCLTVRSGRMIDTAWNTVFVLPEH